MTLKSFLFASTSAIVAFAARVAGRPLTVEDALRPVTKVIAQLEAVAERETRKAYAVWEKEAKARDAAASALKAARQKAGIEREAAYDKADELRRQADALEAAAYDKSDATIADAKLAQAEALMKADKLALHGADCLECAAKAKAAAADFAARFGVPAAPTTGA